MKLSSYLLNELTYACAEFGEMGTLEKKIYILKLKLFLVKKCVIYTICIACPKLSSERISETPWARKKWIAPFRTRFLKELIWWKSSNLINPTIFKQRKLENAVKLKVLISSLLLVLSTWIILEALFSVESISVIIYFLLPLVFIYFYLFNNNNNNFWSLNTIFFFSVNDNNHPFSKISNMIYKFLPNYKIIKCFGFIIQISQVPINKNRRTSDN